MPTHDDDLMEESDDVRIGWLMNKWITRGETVILRLYFLKTSKDWLHDDPIDPIVQRFCVLPNDVMVPRLLSLVSPISAVTDS